MVLVKDLTKAYTSLLEMQSSTMMKHVFRLSTFLGVLACLIGLATVPAEAQLKVRLQQTLTTPTVTIKVLLQNPTGTPYVPGDCDFAFDVNQLAVNTATIGPNIFSPVYSNNPSFAQMTAVYDATSGYILVSMRAVQGGPAVTLAPNATETLAEIKLPILNCTLNNNLSWRTDATLVSDRSFNSLIADPFADLTIDAPTSLSLAPAFATPTMTASAGTPPRPATGSSITMCATERLTLTVPTTPGVTTYRFFAGNVALGPATATPTLSRSTLNPAGAPTINNGDPLVCEVTTAQCSYRTNRITVIVQDKVPRPTLLDPIALDTGLCGVGLSGNQNILRIIPSSSANSYTWTITPSSFGTIVPSAGIGSSATVTWSGAPGVYELSVRGNNFCGSNGDTLRKSFRIYSGIPVLAAPPRRARRPDSTLRAKSYSVNDPNNQFFEFANGSTNIREYEWAVYPDTVQNKRIPGSRHTIINPRITPFTPQDAANLLPSRFKDSLRVKINWQRFTTDTVGYLKYRGRNACGASRWDSIKVNWNALVPRPDTVQTINSSNGSTTDSTCQGTDSTFFRAIFRTAFAGTKYADTTKYRYFITRFDAASRTRLKPYSHLPAATLLPAAIPVLANYPRNFARYFRSDSTGFWALWNPQYYGAVKIIAAGMTDTNARHGGLPTSHYAGVGGLFAPSADTSSMGDTATTTFFIQPKPLRAPGAPVTVPNAISRAIHRGVDTFVDICLRNYNADSLKYLNVKPEYSTSGIWKVRPMVPTPGFKQDTIGTFVAIPGAGPQQGTDYCIRLLLKPNAPSGFYQINMRGINSCGTSLDSSASLKIHITDTIARSAPDIKLLGAPQLSGFDFCQGTASTCYSVKLADSLDFTTYRWKLEPATAGTVSFTAATGARSDSGSICINWSTTFNDFRVGAKLTLTAINGTNKASSGSASSTFVTMRIFPKPTGNSGVAAACGIQMPAFSSAWLGGGTALQNRYAAPAGPFSPTYSRTITSRADSVKIIWTAGSSNPANSLNMLSGGAIAPINVSTATGKANNRNFLNPIFTPTAAGTYNFELVVQDSSGCQSATSTSTFNVQENFNLRVRAYLSGAFVQPVAAANPRMRNDYYTTPSPDYPRPGSFLSRYERNSGQCGSEFMLPGFPIRKIANSFGPATDSLGPVDLIDVGLMTDFNCDPTNGRPLTTVAEGKAWLYPDGTIRDFETGTVDYARLTGSTPPTSNVVAYVANGSHITLISTLTANVVPQTGANPPGGGPAGGTVDFTREANVIRQGAYVSGIGSEWVIPYAPNTPVAQRRVAAIAGNISDRTSSINSFDLEKIIQYLNQSGNPRQNIYRDLDLNLDTKIDNLDRIIVDNNARLQKHAILNK